jgi:DNA-binding CsgD family transcriptional regulator
MSLSYALSTAGGGIADEACEHLISERERECLGWVAEGKTTMDIATILGVSSNTINSYLAHVIQKLSARNRAMAIAVAIRSGII